MVRGRWSRQNPGKFSAFSKACEDAFKAPTTFCSSRSPLLPSNNQTLPLPPLPRYTFGSSPTLPTFCGREEVRGRRRPMRRQCLWVLGFVGLALGGGWVEGRTEVEEWNLTAGLEASMRRGKIGGGPLMVGLTLIASAASKGAVCLDGSLPGYHLHRGFGKGADKWLVHLEGGGWCNHRRACVYSKSTHRGSSRYMERVLPFTGILSNKREENPDFYNWNRVKVRYCDGASFSGEGYDAANKLFFRGQRIWSVAMEEIMSKGMRSAKQALLSGCSAGGLSVILHCDEFRQLFPRKIRVKCLGDAGFFLDVADVAGTHALRNFFHGVVREQGVAKNLPRYCTAHRDPTSCFFPQNLVAHIKTPLFILNSAYDVWQIYEGICPSSADPHGHWAECKKRHKACNSIQLETFKGFRNQMVTALWGFSRKDKNGYFINSCFAHCQSEKQDTWFGKNSPQLAHKRIAQAFGDWYFERSSIKLLDCLYPCDRTCHHIN